MSNPLHNPLIPENWLFEIHRRLLEWHETNARYFPWRETTDPYKIIVAEKLLQQTAARANVVEAYLNFIATYPNLEALSRANRNQVLEIIQGLGLSNRANELPNIARIVLEEHKGKMPHTLNDLLKLPGVGPYIARAVCCFAFGESIAIVDTNIARWIYRLFLIKDQLPTNPARKRDLLELSERLLNKNNSKLHNWAILDLCALLCTARNPNCLKCPLMELCAYGKEQIIYRSEPT